MNENTLRLARFLSLFFAVVLPLGAFNRYVFCDNETNHLGGTPYVLFLVFVPAAFVSLHMLRREGKKWLIPLVFAMAGILNVIAFDAFHVMQGYSSWIRSGMPDRPAWSRFHKCPR